MTILHDFKYLNSQEAHVFFQGKGAYGTVVLGQLKGKKVAVKVLEKEQDCSRLSRSL